MLLYSNMHHSCGAARGEPRCTGHAQDIDSSVSLLNQPGMPKSASRRFQCSGMVFWQINAHDRELKKTCADRQGRLKCRRNPRHWSEPETFDPDRFQSNVTSARHPFAFQAFSSGPRNCIGKVRTDIWAGRATCSAHVSRCILLA